MNMNQNANNNSMVLECKESSDFKPHPEGIHPAVCVDVIDLGLVKTEFQGQEKMLPKVKLVFETEEKTDDGRCCTVSKNFTASLHPKAKLAEFLGKWRGRVVTPGERVDLATLIGGCCTLVISHQQGGNGKTYASIDAVSKPTRTLEPSGGYDPTVARQRIAEWKAKAAAPPVTGAEPRPGGDARSGYRSAAQPEKSTAAGANHAAVKVHVGRCKGLELRDLALEQVQALVTNWLPGAKANVKPTADDKRLMAALEWWMATQPSEGEEDEVPY